MTFVLRFLELGGLDALLSFLEDMDKNSREQPIHTSAITCIQNLMNSAVRIPNPLSDGCARCGILQYVTPGILQYAQCGISVIGHQ